jgi:hypothetical protein
LQIKGVSKEDEGHYTCQIPTSTPQEISYHVTVSSVSGKALFVTFFVELL